MKTDELKKLKLELEADLAAVNRLLDRPNTHQQVVAMVEATQSPKPFSQIAEEVIKTIGKNFDVQDICFEARKVTARSWSTHQSPIVSGIINKLRQRDPSEIEIVVPGKGCRSGVYRYVGPPIRN